MINCVNLAAVLVTLTAQYRRLTQFLSKNKDFVPNAASHLNTKNILSAQIVTSKRKTKRNSRRDNLEPQPPPRPHQTLQLLREEEARHGDVEAGEGEVATPRNIPPVHGIQWRPAIQGQVEVM